MAARAARCSQAAQMVVHLVRVVVRSMVVRRVVVEAPMVVRLLRGVRLVRVVVRRVVVARPRREVREVPVVVGVRPLREDPQHLGRRGLARRPLEVLHRPAVLAWLRRGRRR